MPAHKKGTRAAAMSAEVTAYIKKNAPNSDNIRTLTAALNRDLGLRLKWDAVRVRARSLDVTTKTIRVAVKATDSRDAALDGRLTELLKKRKTLSTLEAISNTLDVSPARVQAAMNRLKAAGRNVITVGGNVELSPDLPKRAPFKINIAKTEGQVFRFGVTGDNHMGSKYQRNDVLEALFDIWAKDGIETVYQLGNMIDGEARFNKTDLLVHGMDGQAKYFAKHWPVRRGITTYFVTGDDHEGWYVQREGIDIGKHLESTARAMGRKDLVYLGHMEHDIVFRGRKQKSVMRLIHAGGGSSYATSYAPQKIVESYQGGEKPNVLLVGHYHKAEYGYPREVHTLQVGCTCFLPATRVTTARGRIPIAKVVVGDKVLTHKGRYRSVLRTMRRRYSGDFYTLWTGRSAAGPSKGQVTATAEHPFLTLNGWREVRHLKAGDWVAIESNTAKGGELMPWYRSVPNGSFFRKTQRKEEKHKTRRHNVELRKHLAAEYKNARVLITDAIVPDAIAIDWKARTVTAVEYERNRPCPNDPRKYDKVAGMYDGVDWVCTARKNVNPRREYRVVDGNVFVQIKKIVRKRQKVAATVCNIEVAEDNSYVAGRHVVHNCDQTPFMRKKKLQAHVGGWTVEMTVNEDGLITRFKAEWMPFYDLGYTRKAWSYRDLAA